MLEDTQLNASVTATDADGENVTFSAGFLGELIDRNASDRNKYLIDKNI